MKILIASLFLIMIITGCAKRQDDSPNIPKLSGFSMPAKNLGDEAFKITEPTSNSTGVISYTSSNATVATVFGDIITITGVGKTTITANQQRLGRFEAGSITADLIVDGFNYGFVKDIDSNIYRTVKIGTQEWMAENLKVTKYRNGSPIPNVTDDRTWNGLNTGAYCYYNDDEALGQVYGNLYNWYAVTDGRQLAPAGWHIPSYNDWITLYNYIGGTRNNGEKLQEVGTRHWFANTGQTNSTYFTALGAGYRNRGDVQGWDGFGFDGIWWTKNAGPTSPRAWAFDLYVKGYIEAEEEDMVNGYSVRCVKDN